MTYKEFDNKFKKEVADWPYERQLDFAVAICKKLFYDYQQFFEENEWGNPDVLLGAISLAERCKVESQDRNLITGTIESVEEVTPDIEDFGGANYALNACVAVCYTLEFLIDKNPDHIYYVGMSFYDTNDARVHGDVDVPEEEIDQHPLMVETRKYLLQGA